MAFAAMVAPAAAQASLYPPGVYATGTQGPTNPPQETAPTAINQTSLARLLTVNSIDDWCVFAPPTVQNISDSETIEVAWCMQARNDARVIPDGTMTGVSFLKTDFYVQVMGYGDLTKLNIPFGDWGGELDPHGAYGSGNPIGGNVTTDITPSGGVLDVAEWMLYIDYDQFCLRVCTNANSTYSAAFMCWHELDEMGCEFVMPGNYNFNGTFETCEADVAYPPGWYPTATVNGTPQFSTFAQYWTGDINGQMITVGDLVTPTAPYFTPSSSNCVQTSTISNGIALTSLGLTGSVPTGAPTASTSGKGGPAPSSGSGSSGNGNTPPKSSASAQAQVYPIVTFLALMSGVAAVALFH